MVSPDSILSPTYSEEEWVSQISKNFDIESAMDIKNIPISVCGVPKSITSIKPEAYAPQVVALGPYHHLKPELYQMERYKIAAVKSFLTHDQILNFQHLLIGRLKEIGLEIRACYHKYLDLNDDTLAWMIAVDGLFLLYILSNYKNDSNGEKFMDDASVFKDVMMLENQIPSILLKEIRKTLQLSNNNDDDDTSLFSMMQAFCESQSPFKLGLNSQFFQDKTSLHLLDLLYGSIVAHQAVEPVAADKQVIFTRQESEVSLQVIQPNELFGNIENIIEVETSLAGPFSMPVQVIEKLPWGMISNLIGLKTGSSPVNSPLVQEIKIPSVSILCKLSGVEFRPTTGGIWDVKFDEVAAIVYLPVITLNANSEVILRNLVAYELANTSRSNSKLVLAQYIDLMSGIIDTEEDAGWLKTRGIINGNLSNVEIADLFNGMNESTGKVYNETTAKINAYFSKKPNVRVYTFLKKRFYGSWKVLTVLSTIVLLLLLSLQSICSVYGCQRFFNR